MATLCAVGFKGYAQQSESDTAATKTKSIFFNTGMQYMSNLTYAGRRDETSVPVLLPNFTVISKRGLFLSAIGYFDVNGPRSAAEGLSVTPGYVFSFDGKKQFGGAISATKYFITSSSPIILSTFDASIDGQLTYDPGLFKFTLAGSYRFGKDNANDIINDAELLKEIWLFKAGANKTNGLKITPTVTLYTGTQSFTETYYTSSQVQRAIENPGSASPINLLFPKQPKQTIIDETVTEEKQREVKKYQVLALSGDLPVTYTLNKWQFSFTPYLIKPFNEISYADNNTTGGNYFMFTVGASVTF